MNLGAMVWSVRRELWENRSITIAPLLVAMVTVFGLFVAMLAGRHSRPDQLAANFELAAGALMATTLIVAIFYCLDALYGERRDRSVLFWKSMPVSDWTAVLSKMAVPLVVLPLVTFVITMVTQLIMLLVASAFLSAKGHGAAPLWKLPWLQMSSGLLHHLVTVHSLYYAPIFGWLLLISAWAKRLPFLWAFLPMAAIGFVEKVIFNTGHFVAMLGSIISGGMEGGGAMKGGLMLLWPSHPIEFLGKPGLWIGLTFAAACLAGAVHLRRYRDPI
jgi:ABC-2 type transport system permease protein